MQDLKFALRQLKKFPRFTATVVLTVALGISANTAIFTLVHAVLLSSLPVADPATLYRIGDRDDCCVNGGFMNDDGDFDLFSYDLYRHFRETSPEFEQLAAMQSGSSTLPSGADQSPRSQSGVNMFPVTTSQPSESVRLPVVPLPRPTTSSERHPLR